MEEVKPENRGRQLHPGIPGKRKKGERFFKGASGKSRKEKNHGGVEQWATSRGGESLFMEKRLIARAVGSPRAAHG